MGQTYRAIRPPSEAKPEVIRHSGAPLMLEAIPHKVGVLMPQVTRHCARALTMKVNRHRVWSLTPGVNRHTVSYLIPALKRRIHQKRPTGAFLCPSPNHQRTAQTDQLTLRVNPKTKVNPNTEGRSTNPHQTSALGNPTPPKHPNNDTLCQARTH